MDNNTIYLSLFLPKYFSNYIAFYLPGNHKCFLGTYITSVTIYISFLIVKYDINSQLLKTKLNLCSEHLLHIKDFQSVSLHPICYNLLQLIRIYYLNEHLQPFLCEVFVPFDVFCLSNLLSFETQKVSQQSSFKNENHIIPFKSMFCRRHILKTDVIIYNICTKISVIRQNTVVGNASTPSDVICAVLVLENSQGNSFSCI